jgi:alpha-galactosidase
LEIKQLTKKKAEDVGATSALKQTFLTFNRTNLMNIFDTINSSSKTPVETLKVSSVQELKKAVREVYEEFQTYGKEAVKTFFSTIEIYTMEERRKTAIYSFDVNAYIELL